MNTHNKLETLQEKGASLVSGGADEKATAMDSTTSSTDLEKNTASAVEAKPEQSIGDMSLSDLDSVSDSDSDSDDQSYRSSISKRSSGSKKGLFFGKRRGSNGSLQSQGGGSNTSGFSILSKVGLSDQVLLSKWLVAIVLATVTGISGYFTYKFTTGDEEDTYETAFYDSADEIRDQSIAIVGGFAMTLQSFANTATSLAEFGNKSWPFLTVPHFEVRAADFLFLTRAQQVSFAPIVDDSNREAWEAYSVENQWWST